MHFITGGAYNGKSAWVRDFYDQESLYWISAYAKHEIPYNLLIYNEKIIVLEGIEQWVLKMIEMNDEINIRKLGQEMLEGWLRWEQEEGNRKLIIIGTDMSKGIVPMEKKNRLWRDYTGWFYQDLVKHCERVDFIWYGIAKQLK